MRDEIGWEDVSGMRARRGMAGPRLHLYGRMVWLQSHWRTGESL